MDFVVQQTENLFVQIVGRVSKDFGNKNSDVFLNNQELLLVVTPIINSLSVNLTILNTKRRHNNHI